MRSTTTLIASVAIALAACGPVTIQFVPAEEQPVTEAAKPAPENEHETGERQYAGNPDRPDPHADGKDTTAVADTTVEPATPPADPPTGGGPNVHPPAPENPPPPPADPVLERPDVAQPPIRPRPDRPMRPDSLRGRENPGRAEPPRPPHVQPPRRDEPPARQDTAHSQRPPHVQPPRREQPGQPPVPQPNEPPAPQPNDPPAHQPNDPPAHQPNDPPAHQPNDPPAHQPNDPPAHQPNDPPAHQPNDPPAPQPNDPPVQPDETDLGTARSIHIPPGHFPRNDACRIWIDGTPPGRQAAPVPCEQLHGAVPAGAFVLYRDQAWDTLYDWVRHAQRNPGTVPDAIVALMASL